VEELIQALELNAEDVASSISTTFMDVGFWNNFEKNIDDLTKIAEGDRGEIQKEKMVWRRRFYADRQFCFGFVVFDL